MRTTADLGARWWPALLVLAALDPALPLGGLTAQSPASASATGNTPTTLDLSGALTLARRSGPLHRVADAREQAGLGRVREGAQWLNPTLEWRRENLGSPLQPDIFATLYVPIDVSGRRLALRQAAAAGRQRVAGDAAAERRDGELGVARAWLRAASADGTLEIAQGQFAALREIADIDAARMKEGLVAEAVGLRTSLEADRARVAVVAARSEAAQAKAQLARLLGLPDGELPPLAPLAAPALPVPPDSAGVRAVALRVRPDVQAREQAVLEAQRRLSAEQRAVFGETQLQGGTKETGGFMTGQIGIAMPFPLFNRNSGARQRVAGELSEARTLRDDVRLAVAGNVAAAWRTYVDVRAAAADAATFDARGREVARIARVSYREGHATLTELLDAERAASDAMHAHVRWAADAWMARLELERAIGARLDAAGPLNLPVLSSLLPLGS